MSGTNLASLVLEDPDGRPVPIESLTAAEPRPRWLVIQAIRYFG